MTPLEIFEQRATLREFGTEHQVRVLDVIEETGSLSGAAERIGCSRGSIQVCLRNLAARAASRGHAPTHDMTRVVPEPFRVKGVSTYYNRDGEPAGQWVKSERDSDLVRQMVEEAATAIAETLPRLAPLPAPPHSLDTLCNLYVITDAHVGMHAWHKEGGADWDLKIAEATLLQAFRHMIVGSPAAKSCVIAQLGDFLHFDGLTPVTDASGHVLDTDTRFRKLVRVAVRILRQVVDMALSRHESVTLLMAEGNHDARASVWLTELFRWPYENEPRLTVIDSAKPYYVHQHGRTMLGFHHGHIRKPADLPLIMAAEYAEMWGATAYRYIHTGHLHHYADNDKTGVRLVQHPTLAARSSYESRGGWLSPRAATVTTYHSTYGQVGTLTVTPEMLEGL